MTYSETLEMLRRIQALRLRESPGMRAVQMMESARRSLTLQDSPVAKMLQDLNNTARLANRLRQESPTLKVMQSIIEATRRPMTIGELPVTKMLQDLNNTARLVNRLRQESPTMKAMQSIIEATRRPMTIGELPVAKMLQDLNNTTRLVNRVRQESPATKAMQSISESARQSLILQESQMAKMLQDLANSTRLMDRALQESTALKALRQFCNLPFSSVLGERVFPDLDLPDVAPIELEDYPDLDFGIDQDVELEIQRELEDSNDYNVLSDRAKASMKNFFLQFFFLFHLILSLLSSSITIYTHLQKTVLNEFKTSREVRSYIRKGIYGVDKELLRGYRVVTGAGVRLRRTPSMKSEIVALLPLGTLIEVLNESNRSWLLAEVDIEGEKVVGWISRRYTKKFGRR